MVFLEILQNLQENTFFKEHLRVTASAKQLEKAPTFSLSIKIPIEKNIGASKEFALLIVQHHLS